MSELDRQRQILIDAVDGLVDEEIVAIGYFIARAAPMTAGARDPMRCAACSASAMTTRPTISASATSSC
jgi:hypothetical protein